MTHRLDPLFNPKGVVVAGASTHPGKFGFVTLHNLLAAGSILVALPVLIVFFVLQKQFVSGLTLGSTKG